MGINGALITSGNTVDLTLARLRDAATGRAPTQGEHARAARARSSSLKAHVRQMVARARRPT